MTLSLDAAAGDRPPRFRIRAIDRWEFPFRLRCTAIVVGLLSGCDGAPSRNILGSYFPSWMVCALIGIAMALVARAIFKASGLLTELPVPFIVMLSIACAGTFALWLVWLS